MIISIYKNVLKIKICQTEFIGTQFRDDIYITLFNILVKKNIQITFKIVKYV
jgi:hypothetical protein